MQKNLIRAGAIAGLILGGATQALATSPFLGPSTVDTGGFFYQYQGPLGGPILNNGTGVDSGTTWFRDRITGNQMQVNPSYEYAPYPWPAFAGSGTGTFLLQGNQPSGPGGSNQFWTASAGVDFWVQYGNTPDPVNTLQIFGNTIPNVSIDPNTGKSGLIKIATVSFTNGTWFGSDPPINPGNGDLYPTSIFAFSLTAFPTPLIGSNPFPGGYHVFNGAAELTTTFGPNTPDYLSFNSFSNIQASVLAVPEGATASVEIWGRIGSLEAVELRNATNGASILAEVPVTAVPEPALVLQWGLGLALLALLGRLRRRG